MFHNLNDSDISNNLDTLLCGCVNEKSLSILSDKNFTPESFTVSDKYRNRDIIFFSDVSYKEWMIGMIKSQIDHLDLGDEVEDKLTRSIYVNLDRLLNTQYNGKSLSETILNQEIIDIIRNVAEYTLYGEIKNKLRPAENFNRLADNIIPQVLDKIRELKLAPVDLFTLSILSGLSGLDLKGAAAAATATHNNMGIRMSTYGDMEENAAVEDYYKQLIKLGSHCSTPIFAWDTFNEYLTSQTRICWFTDDYIESFFDMLFIQYVLDANEDLTIELIPKDGTYGNDLAWQDVVRNLELPIYEKLRHFAKSGRFILSKNGPKMSAANIRKLSDSCIDSIVLSDCLVIKGCRMFEMLQGGIDKESFFCHTVNRNISESESGLCSSKYPVLMMHLRPSEFAFFGITTKNSKTIVIDSTKQITAVASTAYEHQYRKTEMDAKKLISEFNKLKELRANYEGNTAPIDNELNSIADKLLQLTSNHYNNTCNDYKELRTETLHQFEQEIWDLLQDHIERYVPTETASDVSLLDIGASNGRDVLYSTKLGYETTGLDNAEGFINILKKYEVEGRLRENSIVLGDMRDLPFREASFDVVRHHATLLHLPLIGPGYSLDLALKETNRVLKEKGLMFVVVKYGHGLEFLDTAEGLGGRVFQFFNHATLNEVVQRNNFDILYVSDKFSSRNSGKLHWLILIAQKKSQ